MTDKPSTAKPNAREARLGAALRENLRRRKAQARVRAVASEGEDGRQASTNAADDKDRTDR